LGKKGEPGYSAERKSRQRQGYKSYQIETPPSFTTRLVVEGFLLESAKDNKYAIEKAAALWIERQLGKPATPPLPVQAKKTPGPKAKRRRHPKHGPCRQLTQTEIAAAAAKLNAASERRRLDEEWERERDELHRKFRREMEQLDLETLKRRQEFSIAEKERQELLVRKMIESAPEQAPKKQSWQNYPNTGVSKRGGKPLALGLPSVSCGTSEYKRVKPIKQLTAEQQDARIKEKFGPLKEPDSNPHFVPMDPRESAYKLDRAVADWEGLGRPSKSCVKNFQGDDGFTKPGARLFDSDD